MATFNRIASHGKVESAGCIIIATMILVLNFVTARAEPHAVYEIDLVDPISGVWQRESQDVQVKGGFGAGVSFLNRQPLGAPVQSRYGVTVRTQSAEAQFGFPTGRLTKYRITSIQYTYGRRLWHRSWFDINAGFAGGFGWISDNSHSGQDVWDFPNGVLLLTPSIYSTMSMGSYFELVTRVRYFHPSDGDEDGFPFAPGLMFSVGIGSKPLQ